MNRTRASNGRNVLVFISFVIFSPILLPLIIIGLALHLLHEFLVYLLVWVWWLPKGKDVLFVSSDSPIWKEYMETEILPAVSKRAIVLNWSMRKKWPKMSFASRAFRTFGPGRDFNPMVVLFRPFRRAKVFRFLPAFIEWKHGKPTKIEMLRQDLMQALEVKVKV